MESKSIHRYIYLGTVLRYIQDVKAESSNYTSKNVVEHIDKFLALLDEFNLPVALRATNDLKKFREKILSSDIEDENSKLNSTEARELSKIMQNLDWLIASEASGKIAFIVTDKRMDVNKLLSNVSSLMAPDVFNSLPPIAQYDFKEAGRCIAFDVPTAAAFHLMRGDRSRTSSLLL